MEPQLRTEVRPTTSVSASPGNSLEFKIAPEILEISWNLVNVPETLYNWQFTFRTSGDFLYTVHREVLGKQDHFTCFLILYGLSRKKTLLEFVKNVPWI